MKDFCLQMLICVTAAVKLLSLEFFWLATYSNTNVKAKTLTFDRCIHFNHLKPAHSCIAQRCSMSAKEKHFSVDFAPCDATVSYCRWSPANLFAISGWHDFDHRLCPQIYK